MHEHSHSHSSGSHFISDLVRFAFIALLIVLPFRIFIAQPFIVNGQSMIPSFDSGEYLIVDQITYTIKDPHRGDVVVFRYPKDPDQFYIKRLIGMPTETVRINDGRVTIYTDKHPEGFTLEEPYVTAPGSVSLEVTLAPDEYFVLGDNRTASSDSRRWGPLNARFIQGRPLIRLFPLGEFGLMPGDYAPQQSRL